MKISIVTVCLNARSVIRECLDSVAQQTYRNFEHVIIDGSSTDGTHEVARRYPHVTSLLSEPDRGLYDAMNKSLARVSGDYVLFLNADDRLYKNTTLAETADLIKNDPGADVYYGWLEVRDLSGNASTFCPPPPRDVPAFMVTGCLPHQSTLARPSVFDKTGPFDLEYRICADYDWYLKILADPTIDVRAIPCTVGSFREGGASYDLAKSLPEVYAIQNGSRLYADPAWDQRRIDMLQGALLAERLNIARLSANRRRTILSRTFEVLSKVGLRNGAKASGLLGLG
jgi:hypothetical protein